MIKINIKSKKKFYRYSFIGVINTILNFSIFNIILYFNLHIYIAGLSGFLIGALVSYILNSKYTFKTKKRSHKQFLVFLIIQIFIINISALLISLLNKFILDEPNIAWALSTFSVIFLNYKMQKNLFEKI